MVRATFLAVLALALLPVPARAAEETAEQRAEVERLASEAVKLYDAGEYEEALELYREAHGVWPLAALSYMEARCLEGLGRPRDAVRVLERALAEEPDRALRKRVATLLESTRAKLVGRLKVAVTPREAELVVDGTPRTPGADGTLELAAGRHEVVVRRPGHVTVTREVEVPGGGTAELSVTLAQTEEPRPRGGPPPVTPTVEGRQWYESAWGWSTAGTALACGVVATTLLVLVKSDRDELRDLQDEGLTVESMSQKAAFAQRDKADRMETAGVVMAGVGGAALVSSIVLFATYGGGSDAPAVTVAPDPSGGGAALSVLGRF